MTLYPIAAYTGHDTPVPQINLLWTIIFWQAFFFFIVNMTLFFLQFIYLKQDTFHPLFLPSHMPTIAGFRTGQMLETQSSSPTLGAGIQLLELLPAASLPSKVHSRKLESEGERGPEPRCSKMGCEHLRQHLNHYTKCLPYRPWKTVKMRCYRPDKLLLNLSFW